MNRIKRQLIDKACRDGAMERLDTLLSGAYLLVSGASVLTAMAETLLERYAMNLGRIKYLMNQTNTAMARYATEFAQLVGKNQANDYFKDVDGLLDLFFTWSQMPREWKAGDPVNTEIANDIVIKASEHKEPQTT